jgi:4'-phosphopantetheinyl transferase EntD
MKVELFVKSELENSIVFVFRENLNERPIGAVKMKHQQMIVRRCLAEIFNLDSVNLKHLNNGAPFLPDYPDQYISISHSREWYAIQLSKVDEVGVDIQLIKENIFEGRSYFVNQEEDRNIDLTNLNLNLIWSTKEALYKLKKGEVDHYKDSITVIRIEENYIIARVDAEIISCGYKIMDDTVLVYTN